MSFIIRNFLAHILSISVLAFFTSCFSTEKDPAKAIDEICSSVQRLNVGENNQNRKLIPVAILLFKGTQIDSRIIRIATSSEYNHVGLLLRDQDNPKEEFCFEMRGLPSYKPSQALTFKGIP